jgi:hypothetical protein
MPFSRNLLMCYNIVINDAYRSAGLSRDSSLRLLAGTSNRRHGARGVNENTNIYRKYLRELRLQPIHPMTAHDRYYRILIAI